MSMELYILSDIKLASIGDWQKSIDEDGQKLRLSTARLFNDLHGGLPVTIGSTKTAFECDHWEVEDVIDGSPNIRFGRRWKYALAFRWGGDIDAGVAAYAAAASYAKATDGVILDCEEGQIISPQRALEISNEIAGGRAQIEAAVRMATEMFQKRKT